MFVCLPSEKKNLWYFCFVERIEWLKYQHKTQFVNFIPKVNRKRVFFVDHRKINSISFRCLKKKITKKISIRFFALSSMNGRMQFSVNPATMQCWICFCCNFIDSSTMSHLRNISWQQQQWQMLCQHQLDAQSTQEYNTQKQKWNTKNRFAFCAQRTNNWSSLSHFLICIHSRQSSVWNKRREHPSQARMCRVVRR